MALLCTVDGRVRLGVLIRLRAEYALLKALTSGFSVRWSNHPEWGGGVGALLLPWYTSSVGIASVGVV